MTKEIERRYREAAESMLAKDHGDDYKSSDIDELTKLLIDHDKKVVAQQNIMLDIYKNYSYIQA